MLKQLRRPAKKSSAVPWLRHVRCYVGFTTMCFTFCCAINHQTWPPGPLSPTPLEGNKQWLQAGHKLESRHVHGQNNIVIIITA